MGTSYPTRPELRTAVKAYLDGVFPAGATIDEVHRFRVPGPKREIVGLDGLLKLCVDAVACMYSVPFVSRKAVRHEALTLLQEGLLTGMKIGVTKNCQTGIWTFYINEELEYTQAGTSADAYGLALEGWAVNSDGEDNGISLDAGTSLAAKLNGAPYAFTNMPLIVDNLSEPNYPAPPPTTSTIYFGVPRGAFTPAQIFAYYGPTPPAGGYIFLTGYEKFTSNDGDDVAIGPGSWDCPADANPDTPGWNPECVGAFHGDTYLIDSDGNQISNRVAV